MSQKPANDQHALAGLGETLVGLETEKNKKKLPRGDTNGVGLQQGVMPLLPSLGGISDECPATSETPLRHLCHRDTSVLSWRHI